MISGFGANSDRFILGALISLEAAPVVTASTRCMMAWTSASDDANRQTSNFVSCVRSTASPPK
eukprot:6531739-Prorocentrum_lima.AAC.1